MLTKEKRHQSKKLRESARGMPCFINIPNVCNQNPETTVLCHLNGGGMGTKKSDVFAAFGCSACHDVIDGRASHGLSPHYVKEVHKDAVFRTQQYWLDTGVIKL